MKAVKSVMTMEMVGKIYEHVCQKVGDDYPEQFTILEKIRMHD